jgi:hypothetical protein
LAWSCLVWCGESIPCVSHTRRVRASWRAYSNSLVAHPSLCPRLLFISPSPSPSPNIFERLIVPMGGCTLIQVERTDTLPNGSQIPLGPTFAYFKIDTCEWVNNGYVAFGSLHTDNRCLGQGSATSHVLPRGCMESAVNTGLKLSATFTCG